VIVVLTSGVALGVHVPGLLLARRLRERGVEAQVEVFEHLLPEERRLQIGRAKRLFRDDFRAARAGQRLTRDLSPLLDGAAVRTASDRWHEAPVRTFVVLSGFWLPVLERFLAGCGPDPPEVDLLHVDSCLSPSWRLPAATAAADRHRSVWLLDAAGPDRGTAAIPWTIPVSAEDPVPWSARRPRVLSHGGGWGMGTYRNRGRELLARGIGLDMVFHDPADADAPPGDARRFVIDPGWEPWHDDGFPPFGEVGPDGAVRYGRAERHHEAFHLTRRASAVLSKPGGGTLLDSLWAATPVVLLEPAGSHEAANARLWERLGFGIRHERWLDQGCGFDLLEPLHRNLLVARSRAPSYVDALVGGAGR
jgi:hypothetical protein